MFRGRSYHTVDEKGRIAIPTRFREPLKETGETKLVVTNLDGYLPVFTPPQWQKIENKLIEQVSILDKELQRFNRFFLGAAEPCSMDKQGRILVPASLREYAKLTKDVALVGLGNRFEIWNKEVHDLEMEEVENGAYSEQARETLAKCLVSI